MPWEEVKKEKRTTIQEKREGFNRRKLLFGLSITAVLIIVAILAPPKIFKRGTLDNLVSPDGRISVAVMPFQNMTNDSTKNDWQNWIQDILITYLSNSGELKVRQSRMINSYMQDKGLTNYASITRSVASSISQKLESNVLVYGNIMQYGATIRLNTQLINSKTEEVIKSFQVEAPAREEMVVPLMDSLSTQVNNFLIISILKKKVLGAWRTLISTNSPEAYKYFTLAINAHFEKNDFNEAIKLFMEAIRIDSNFFMAKIQLAASYRALGNINEAKKWILQVYEKRDQMPPLYNFAITLEYAIMFETPYEEIKYAKLYLDLDDQNTMYWWQLGNAYAYMYQYDKAIPAFEKGLEIHKKRGTKPTFRGYYSSLGIAYHKIGKYKKEKKLYKEAEQVFPDFPGTIVRQAVLALAERDEMTANRYIEKLKSIGKDKSWTEAVITTSLAGIYSEANLLDKAEEYYRKALALEPENLGRMNTLAYFLIDKDRSINEGLELVDKALESDPVSYKYLHTKGWGLYKQGKYKEALEILQKCWDIIVQELGYDHEVFLHFEEAKKAVAGQK